MNSPEMHLLQHVIHVSREREAQLQHLAALRAAHPAQPGPARRAVAAIRGHVQQRAALRRARTAPATSGC